MSKLGTVDRRDRNEVSLTETKTIICTDLTRHRPPIVQVRLGGNCPPTDQSIANTGSDTGIYTLDNERNTFVRTGLFVLCCPPTHRMAGRDRIAWLHITTTFIAWQPSNNYTVDRGLNASGTVTCHFRSISRPVGMEVGRQGGSHA